MTPSILALPVTVEQLAATIRQMSAADLQRLLTLVPALRHIAVQAQPQMPDATWTAVERVRNDVTQALADQRLSPDDPFLGDLTLGQYLDLPDEERACLWQVWTETDLDALEERDVNPDALPAR